MKKSFHGMSLSSEKSEALKNLRLTLNKKIEIIVMLYLKMNQAFIFIVQELVDVFQKERYFKKEHVWEHIEA